MLLDFEDTEGDISNWCTGSNAERSGKPSVNVGQWLRD